MPLTSDDGTLVWPM